MLSSSLLELRPWEVEGLGNGQPDSFIPGRIIDAGGDPTESRLSR